MMGGRLGEREGGRARVQHTLSRGGPADPTDGVWAGSRRVRRGGGGARRAGAGATTPSPLPSAPRDQVLLSLAIALHRFVPSTKVQPSPGRRRERQRRGGWLRSLGCPACTRSRHSTAHNGPHAARLPQRSASHHATLHARPPNRRTHGHPRAPPACTYTHTSVQCTGGQPGRRATAATSTNSPSLAAAPPPVALDNALPPCCRHCCSRCDRRHCSGHFHRRCRRRLAVRRYAGPKRHPVVDMSGHTRAGFPAHHEPGAYRPSRRRLPIR